MNKRYSTLLATVILPLFLFLASTLTWATDAKKKCPPGGCLPREVCFNILCRYEKTKGPFDDSTESRWKQCKAGAQFKKNVSHLGYELEDIAQEDSLPAMEVSCDHKAFFNGPAHRYTDELGTRIQAVGGPFPAIVLPKRVLAEGHRYSLSTLELDGELLKGYCFIYTGPQL